MVVLSVCVIYIFMFLYRMLANMNEKLIALSETIAAENEKNPTQGISIFCQVRSSNAEFHPRTYFSRQGIVSTKPND